MTVRWCMLPQTWSPMDRIFCHFGPFFCPSTPLPTRKIKIWKNEKKTPRDIIILYMCTTNYNHMMYGSWDMERVTDSSFCYFGMFFCPFTPLTTRKIKIFKKWKKKPGDIIILHMSKINDNNMMYGSWNIERDGHNFLSFWTIFYTFTPLTTQKIKILKKWTKAWRYIILHMCTINDNHMMYGSSAIKSYRQNFFVILDYFLHSLSP